MAVLSACEEATADLGTPEISISTNEMNFEAEGGDQDMTVTSTRDWKVETDADWVVVSPESGEASANAQTVTVSALPNTGMDRSADLVFTIGLKKQYLTVNQAGPGGSAEALIVYSNNFDISKAQNNSGWPYLDSNYDLWDNKKGTGAETVEYEFGGKMSVRTSGKASNDGSGYSHYAGSGSNKIFFGAATSILKINKITLDGTATDFVLTYGGQKYLQDGDSNFSFDEFKVYVSNDSQKWVELNDAFAEGADINGDWNLATATFTVPAGTTQLGLAFVATASSAYSIDDVLLQVASQAGQVIDFSAGVEIGGTTGGSTDSGSSDSGSTDGGNTGTTAEKPETLVKATVAEFLAAAESTTVWYELTGEIISIEKQTYGNFTIKDATGEIYIYGMTNGWVGSNNQSFSQIGLKVGDTVTLGTLRTSYNGTAQGGGNSIPAYYISHVAGEAPVVTPTSGKYVLVAAEQADWSGKYLIVFGTSAHASLTSKDLNATVMNLAIANGEIAANSEIDAAALTVAKNGQAYSMLLPSGKYFGMQKNGCKVFDAAFDLNFEYTASGVKISGYVEAESNTFYLYHNSNNGDYYRCYVEKTQSGYDFPQLYKYIAE